ncbi:MAG: hypothetical protein AB7S78_08450 [Candidatus Omnitrophota bacterium]
MLKSIQRNFITMMLFSIAFVTGAVPLGAEDPHEPFYQSRTSRYDTMKTLKDDITALITENKKLEERYSRLKEQWHILQTQKRLDHEDVELKSRELFQPQVRPMNLVQQEMDQYLDGQQMDGSQKRYLNGELMDYSEHLSLLELHLADLQYQRRELELELKLIKVQNQDKEREALVLLEQKKIAVQEAMQKERQLVEQITRKEESMKTAPAQIPLLEKENQNLEEKILSLEKKKEFKERELTILKDKKMLKEKSAEQFLTKIEKERQELKSRVDSLKAEHNQLSDKVATSLSLQDRKNELIRGIMQFDQENQKLQARIDEMSPKLKSQE